MGGQMGLYRSLLFALAFSSLLGAQPMAPTGVEASDGVYTRKVGLSWDHVRDAVLYEVLRSESADSAQAVSVGTTASIIFYDPTATAGQTYTYWVRAHGESASSELSAPDQGLRAVGKEVFDGFLVPLEPPPVPAGNPTTGAKVYLGKTLFWEEQLSSTRTVACGTCHQPRFGSSDPRSAMNPTLAAHPGADGVFGNDDDVIGSPGVPLNLVDGSYAWSETFGLRQEVTRRKAQSAVDSAYTELAFWDGRATGDLTDPVTGEVVLASGAALENQALHPLADTTEMGAVGRKWSDIVARLAASKPLGLSPAVPTPLATWIGDRGYPELFAEAYGDAEITPPRIAMAIGAYERTLYSDRTLHDQAISEIRTMGQAEDRGSRLFVNGNCRLCHQTTLFTDNRFKNIALHPEGGDEGRFAITGNPRDLVAFKTPTLLNVAFRGPFMHDGSLGTLQDVVEFYNRGGDFDAPNVEVLIQPLGFNDGDKADLIAFMTNELTDPRVPAEAGPLFDRPMLYADSARVPELVGDGTPGFGGVVPQVVALEPPFAGNPSFTVGLYDARPGRTAFLVIDDQIPPLSAVIAQATSAARDFFEREVAAEGYASAVVPLPDEPGLTLFGRWYVADPTASLGRALTPAFRMQLFSTGGAVVDPGAVASVSAASFAQGLVAPESLVSAFGSDLAAFEESASLPLPTVLGGASLLVKDRTGAERLARLIYASPTQMNYEVPAGTASGEASLTVLRGGVAVAVGTIQVGEVAPGLFAANSNGMGPAAAQALHVAPGGEQTMEPVAVFEAGQGEYVASPIDMGPEGDEVYLILFGTGMRYGDDVHATVGGATVDVVYSGAHSTFVGLDQVNIKLPRSLAGKGDVEIKLTVNGVVSNTLRVRID